MGFNRWAYLKARSDVNFDRLSTKVASLLKEITYLSKMEELEVRLASVEDVYRRTNDQLEKANLDYSQAIERQNSMQKKLEETESVLERTFDRIHFNSNLA